MNYTDTQLKQALAKMLPDKTRYNDPYLFWDTQDEYRQVLDTELLHLCWLVEETIWDTPSFEDYMVCLSEQVHSMYQHDHFVHATWQQRTIALAKVKGVEI